MASVDLYEHGQPMDPMLAMAVESAFRRVSLTPVQFVPAPRSWRASNPSGPQKGHSSSKPGLRKRLAQRDGARCGYCARPFVDLDDATLDHVIPNSIVGHWQPWNLLLACEACNNLKADHLPLVLMPFLCHLLRYLSTAQDLNVRSKSARKKARQKARRRARKLNAERSLRARRAIEAMAGHPVRLAIEAAPTRAHLTVGGE